MRTVQGNNIILGCFKKFVRNDLTGSEKNVPGSWREGRSCHAVTGSSATLTSIGHSKIEVHLIN